MKHRDQRITFAERLYGLLLALYPKHFRQEYGPSMYQVFREMLRDDDTPIRQVGLRLFTDIAGSLLPEYRASFRGRTERMRSYAYGLLLGLLLCVGIVISSLFSPALAEVGVDDSSVMPLTAACLLLFFAASGYLASHNTAPISSGARIGALTALLGMGIAMLTFVVVDNLFLNLVSQQPEKIWGFQHSGYTTMRAYINAGHLRAVVFVLPALVLVGSVCGTLGAVARSVVQGRSRANQQ